MTQPGKNTETPAGTLRAGGPGSHVRFNEGDGALHWNYRIPLIANAILWQELILTLGVPFLIIAAIVTFFADAHDRTGVLIIFIFIFAIVLLVAFLVMLHLSRSLGGGIDAAFFLNATGVGYKAGEAAKRIHRNTLLLSLISGSVNAAGTTLVALSAMSSFIAWPDVKKVKIHRRARIIYIWSKEEPRPIALYCTPEMFDPAVTMIRKFVKVLS